MKLNFYSKNLRTAISLVFIFLFSSCVYFNTFYNAKVAYKDALRIINLMDYTETSLPPEAKRLLDLSIANSRVVLEKYPKSKHVEEAYYLLASSMFLKEDYISSKEYLNILINRYPNGEYYKEANLRLISIHVRENDLELADNIIQDLKSNNNLNKYETYLLNTIYAEIHIINTNTESAYKSYQDAIESASNDAQRIKIYNKLIQLSERQRDYENLLVFIDGLYRNLSIDSDKKELKLLSLEYNKKLNRYDYLVSEIENMLNQSLFEDKRLFLSVELAKSYYYLEDYVTAEEILLEIVDIYSRKNETAEAYYFLAQINIKNDFDLEILKDLFNKSKSERSSSKYGKLSKELVRKLDDLETLIYDYKGEELSESGLKDSNKNFSEVLSDKDSLLFTMAQMYYFDFNQIDSSISKHSELTFKFPNSKFAPKSLFALSIIDSSNKQWKEKLVTEYPDQNFEESENEGIKNSSYSQEYYDALNLLESGFYDKAYPILKEINLNSDNKESLFYLGYINEVYTLDIEKMLSYYIEYLNEGKDFGRKNQVKEKLSIYYYMFHRKSENLYLKNQISKCLSEFEFNRQNSKDLEALEAEKEALFESVWFDCNIEGVSKLDTTKVDEVLDVDLSDKSLKTKYEDMKILANSWNQFKVNLKFIDDSFGAYSLNDSLWLSAHNYIFSLDLKIPVKREDPPVRIDPNFSYILSNADIEKNTLEIIQLQNYKDLYENLIVTEIDSLNQEQQNIDVNMPTKNMPFNNLGMENMDIDKLKNLKK